MGRTIEDLQADIEAGVGDLVAGEGWQRWLAVAARFPRYSFRNQLLILAQRPDARVVMGYRAWQALGHQVRRGEQSISILAPCTYKTKPTATGLDGDTPGDDRDVGAGPTARRVLRGFRVAHVFDIAQTDGTGVQPPQRPQLLDGEAPAGLWDTLAALVAAAGFTLTRSDLANGANGVTNFTHRTVTIAPHLTPAQAAKTLAHELAHVTMHTGTEYATGCRGRAEIEAESVAYIVCSTAGLHSAGYSFGYVAHWAGGDMKAIKETADRVSSMARRHLDAMGLVASTGPVREAEAAIKTTSADRRQADGRPGTIIPPAAARTFGSGRAISR